MKSKIIMRVTARSEIAFWRRKGVVDDRQFKFRADVERDRYFAEQRKYSLKTKVKR